MIYLVTNITDITPDPAIIYINDIPNRSTVKILPGHSVDLEVFSTRNQIQQSVQLKVHQIEFRVTIDVMGSDATQRWLVDAVISDGDISVGSVTLDEPIAISAFVGGLETSLTGSSYNGKVSLDVNAILPSVPTITNLSIDPGTPVTYTLPADSRKFLVKTRGCSSLALSYTGGGDIITIPKGNSFQVENVDCSNLTLYLSSSKSDIVEIETWKYS